MEFINGNLLKDHTAATETVELDLPRNPISHCIISLDGYNVTDEATLAEILAFINKVEVVKSGVVHVSLESEDLYALNAYLYGHPPVLTGKLATDNEQRNLGLIVPFGRRVCDPDECLPGPTSGDLKLRIDCTVPSASLDNGTLNVDCVQLPGAQPARTMLSKLHTVSAPGATGENDVDLPIGNELVCVQLRLTTIPTTSSHTYGVDEARILMDDKEKGFVSAQGPCLEVSRGLRLDEQHSTIAAQGLEPCGKIFWLDFDPNGDGKFLLDSSPAKSLKCRLNMGVNEATYMSVVELAKVA